MASNTTYRAALTKKPQYILMAAGLIVLLIAAAIKPEGYSAIPQPTVAVSVAQPIVRAITSPRPLKERFFSQLSDRDRQHYAAAYAAQAKEDWSLADNYISELSDHVLVGDLLAERYLSESYITYFDQLQSWLAHYSDHPDAVRIYRLALRKMPEGETLTQVKPANGKLRGYGTVNGIGNTQRPAGWKDALRLYKAGEYGTAEKQFTKIANRAKNSWYQSAAYFWAARSANLTNAKQRAANLYKAASRHEHTLYGILAKANIGEAFLDEAFAADTDHALYNSAAIRRAAAFEQLGMQARMSKELRYAFVHTNREGKEQLVHIAAALDLPGLQLRMSQSLWYNEQRHHAGDYPLPRWEMAEHSAEAPESLLFAIARQESGFNAKAKSKAGARGIMQIMPDTAQYIIRKNRLNEVRVASADGSFPRSSFTLRNLEKPEINLSIGAHYVDYLNEKSYIDGSIVHLLAAYNAGPGNLRKWNRSFGKTKDPLLFVESIPFKETRHYVQQTLTNYLMYSLLQDGSTEAIQQLNNGSFPRI